MTVFYDNFYDKTLATLMTVICLNSLKIDYNRIDFLILILPEAPCRHPLV